METTEDKRQEILTRLMSAQEETKKINDELKAFDYKDRFARANIHVGKYYKEPNKHHPDCIRCVFVHGIDSESCELKSMEARYWTDQDDWYTIENHSNFQLKGYDDDEDKFVEITKEEFMEHHAQVVRRIELITKAPFIEGWLPSVEEAGVIALNTISEGAKNKLTANEQGFFIAGFQECIKYLQQR